jgi:glycosyltransferase involved in cell wall biosynthesis
MKICLLGFDNLPVLAAQYANHRIGGESVQQTLLARALARRGHQVSMVVADYGQPEGAEWDGIRVLKAYRRAAGVPVFRFIHPRWTATWAALRRADADVYYTSCAGMHVGLVALFCRHSGRRFVFRTASDADCDPASVPVFVRWARDRWLYAYGLRHADAILVQSNAQAQAIARGYGVHGHVAPMLVEKPSDSGEPRDIDVLWVGNLKRVKRPDRILELAEALREFSFHVVGGGEASEQMLFRDFTSALASHPNVVFHGRLSYADTNRIYERSRLLVNTSDVEGFPNVYLQAWIRGIPVVTLIDPDRIIARHGLGICAASPARIGAAIRALLNDARAWESASKRCRAFMNAAYDEDSVIAEYLRAFRGAGPDVPDRSGLKPSADHV